MKEVYCGTSGSELRTDISWEDLQIEDPWTKVIQHLIPQGNPRPVQSAAIEKGILESRRHLIVSAPTNGGKTLVGYLVLLRAAMQGGRTILLEPLRVLARDKAEDLRDVTTVLENATGTTINVRLSTGDYRREDEHIFDDPPDGEIIVATPERLEALSRNGNDDWIQETEAVVVDEAHLIGDGHRGATLEYLVTFLRALPFPPRISLLSATLRDLKDIEEWMEPCDVISVDSRHPPLEKYILKLEEGESTDDGVLQWTEEALQSEEAQVLIFVYQTRSAEKTASLLQEELGDLTGEEGAQAYHSRLGSNQREEIKEAFASGRSRVVVTTTSLKMGVNFPASHVLVRDTMFYGTDSPRLEVTDLLQMMGRAGRGSQQGTAAVLLKQSSGWTLEELEEGLRQERLPRLTSAFEKSSLGGRDNDVASKVAAFLGHLGEEGANKEEFRNFFAESLSGGELISKVDSALHWLQRGKLAYQEDGRFCLTALGAYSVEAMFPLSVAKGWSRLLRDILTVDSTDDLLREWRPLDHILLLEMLFEPISSLRRYSQRLEKQVHTWCERNPSKQPILFREWIRGAEGHSRANQVFGSLEVEPRTEKSSGERPEWARRQAYKAMFRTLVIYERMQGKDPRELGRTYDAENLDGIEEQWRDTLMWLLAGLAKVLDIRSFYYHLQENCDASSQRVKRVKRALRDMEYQTYELQERLKYLSPLGSALRQMRRVITSESGKVGIGTIRRLEENGVTSLQDLANADTEELEDLGVSPQYADQVRNYLDMRMRR
jgi:replicative superfamily II helicase